MNPSPQSKAESIFRKAQALESDERERFLTESCAGDLDLRNEVEDLLLESAPPGEGDTLRAGTVLAGRFRIVRLLGRGGMGAVYEAGDLELGGRVALKTILDKLVPNANALGRFRREVQLARQVTHPNVCRIFDVGRADVHGAQTLFFTMELLDGEPLSHYLRRRGRMTTGEALPLIRNMAAGLAALHAQGIVHRDIKPGNVIVVSKPGAAPRAVLGDFGLARAFESGDAESITQTGHLVGTPDYMAPEQLLGQPPTPAVDVYALGLVMYEMMTGARAFGGSRNAVARITQPPVPPREAAPELPEHWAATIVRCLAMEPSQRPTADALASALTDELAATKTIGVRIERRQPRRVWLWILAAALLTVAVAVFTAPVKSLLRQPAAPAAVASVHDQYLQATDLLHHSYRPNSVETALGILQKVVQDDPEFALGHAALGEAYWHQWRVNPEAVEKARASCLRAIQLDKGLAPPHVTLGRIYTETGRIPLAAEELRIALDLDPRSAEAHWAQAELFQKVGRTSEVEPELKKAMDLAPSDWRWPNQLGRHYLSIGRLEDAARQFVAVIGLAEDNAFAYNNLGQTYVRLGRLRDARAPFEKSLALNRRPMALSNLGMILHLEGKDEEAVRMYEQAIAMNPDDHRAVGNLAAVHLWSGTRKAEAVATYTKAIDAAEKLRKTQPADAQLLADLSGYYAAVANRESSLRLLREAAMRGPEDPDVLFRIGETYEALGDRQRALEFIGRAVKRGYPPALVHLNRELKNLRADSRFPPLLTP